MRCVNVFDHVGSNPMTAVGASYKSEDIMRVWTELSKQIIDALKESKGMIIKGLGTFSLSNWSLETGNNQRTLNYCRPVFVMSTSLQEDYDLYQPKQYMNDAIPLVPIHLQRLAQVCQLSKEKVAGCIEETVWCFRRLLSEGKDVEFPLRPLGKLTVSKTNVFFALEDSCDLRTPKISPPCAKYAQARTTYSKRPIVPCQGHSKKTF